MEGTKTVLLVFKALKIVAAVAIAATFSISVVFTLGYMSSFIYLIGYENQLFPLFEGIILGTVLFTVTGAVISRFRTVATAISAVLAGILFAAVLIIMHATNLVVPNNLLLLCAFLITACFMPITSFSLHVTGVTGRWARASATAATAVLGILSIAFIAMIYEGSGQTDLAMITSTLSYLTILVLGMSLMATVSVMKLQH